MAGKDQKKRKTVSIDKDIYDRFRENDSMNDSAVANKLFREYFAAGRSPEAAMNVRLREIESQIERKRQEKARTESEIERLEREREDITEQIRQRNKRRNQQVFEVVELIENDNFPKENLVRDNDVVAMKAEEAGMTPKKFIESVEAEL